MKLKDWRKSKNFTQSQLAEELSRYAANNFPDAPHKLAQRTLSSWEERGALPRKYWLEVIAAYTKNKVCANDFVPIAQAAAN